MHAYKLLILTLLATCTFTANSHAQVTIILDHQEEIPNSETNVLLRVTSNYGYGVQDSLTTLIDTDQQVVSINILIEPYAVPLDHVGLPSSILLDETIDLGKFLPGVYEIDFSLGPENDPIAYTTSSFVVSVPEPSTGVLIAFPLAIASLAIQRNNKPICSNLLERISKPS